VSEQDVIDSAGGNSTQQLKTLVDIGKALSPQLSLDEIYQVTMEKVSQLLKPSSWSLMIVDETTHELRFDIAVSSVADKLKTLKIPMDEGISGYVASHGEALLVPDVSKDERFSKKIDEEVGFETSSIICVPLKTQNKVIGVVQLVNVLGQRPFTVDDLTILSTVADFTAIAIENSRLVDQVKELTIIDDLTGVYNARHFQKVLDYEVERACRQRTELSLVFIDLDHFKTVNDTYGHETGNVLLRGLAQTIKTNKRLVDHVARYGGDEFVVLLPDTGNAGALGMINNLRDKIRNADFRSETGEKIDVTISVGIATYPTNAPDKKTLLVRADKAMYAVKQSTRDGVKTAFDLMRGAEHETGSQGEGDR